MKLSEESINQDQINDFKTIEQTMEKLPDGARRLAAQLTTTASFNSLWSVLTDYERLSLFIPNLLLSKELFRKETNIHVKQIGSQDFLGFRFSAEVLLDLHEEKDNGLIKFNLIKGDFRKFEGYWKIQPTANPGKNSLIYDLTVKGCQWMPIGMIEKRLKRDLSDNLIAVERQAKLFN